MCDQYSPSGSTLAARRSRHQSQRVRAGSPRRALGRDPKGGLLRGVEGGLKPDQSPGIARAMPLILNWLLYVCDDAFSLNLREPSCRNFQDPVSRAVRRYRAHIRINRRGQGQCDELWRSGRNHFRRGDWVDNYDSVRSGDHLGCRQHFSAGIGPTDACPGSSNIEQGHRRPNAEIYPPQCAAPVALVSTWVDLAVSRLSPRFTKGTALGGAD